MTDSKGSGKQQYCRWANLAILLVIPAVSRRMDLRSAAHERTLAWDRSKNLEQELMQLVSAETASVLGQHHPEALQELCRLENVLDGSSLDMALLDLCKSFFATSLRGETWSADRELSELESDCLEVCEQFMVSVASMSNEQVASLARHLGADELYNLMYAIYLLESSERLNLVIKAVMQ